MGPCVAGGPGGLQEAWARSWARLRARALVRQPSQPHSRGKTPAPDMHTQTPSLLSQPWGQPLSLLDLSVCVTSCGVGAEGLGVENDAVPSQAGKSICCDQLGIYLIIGPAHTLSSWRFHLFV